MNRSYRLGKLNILTCFGIVLALAAVLLLAGRSDVASATSGGIGIKPADPPARGGNSTVRGTRFGTRTLREGMAGADVKVLKSIVRSKRLLSGRVTGTFDRPTTSAVRRFQNTAGMAKSGIVNRNTAKAMARSLRTSVATWYGPGFYGNRTACGQTLRPKTVGVAHKTLPCGSKVLIGFRGRYVIVPVIDRGPYGAGRSWDLTAAASRAVGMTRAGVGRVRHAVISR